MLQSFCEWAKIDSMLEKGKSADTGLADKMEKQSQGVILCASSKYEEKYYLNPDFDGLPAGIQDELQVMCVLYTEDIGGILTLEYDEEGNLEFVTMAHEDDILYDDIGSVLKIKDIRNTRRELLESLELYYKVVFLGQPLDLSEE